MHPDAAAPTTSRRCPSRRDGGEQEMLQGGRRRRRKPKERRPPREGVAASVVRCSTEELHRRRELDIRCSTEELRQHLELRRLQYRSSTPAQGPPPELEAEPIRRRGRRDRPHLCLRSRPPPTLLLCAADGNEEAEPWPPPWSAESSTALSRVLQGGRAHSPPPCLHARARKGCCNCRRRPPCQP
jgi:hypothetical protein